jgi:hypothetical protein
MRRYFISQHPTFGSYSNPTKWTIEQSPYFYWWTALTLNSKYIGFCSDPTARAVKRNRKIQTIYEDFGDVRYEGSKYLAFTKWWTAKLANGETRGAYLFAEPQTEKKVELIDDHDLARQLISDDNELVIRISKGMRRSHIDQSLNRIFARHMEFEKGRQTRNPKRSKARYSLSRPTSIGTLQTAFTLLELVTQAEQAKEAPSNFDLAKQIGLEVTQRSSDQVWNAAYQRRVVSVAVSRKKKFALTAIANVAKGVFP